MQINKPIKEIMGSNTPVARKSPPQSSATIVRGNGFGASVCQVLRKQNRRVVMCTGYGIASGSGFAASHVVYGAGRFCEGTNK